MRVRLLNYTPKPVETVYTAARTCYSEQKPSEIWANRVSGFKMGKLLDKTIESGHHSILEHISFTFSVEGISRAASHQLVRHRIVSFSQQSQRYTSLANTDFVVPPSIQYNAKAKELFEQHLTSTQDIYDQLIELGVAKEDARFIMPNATTTNIVMTMNFRELWHIAGIRLCRRAQWEIRDLFIRVKSELHSVPELTGFADYLGPVCEKIGYCPEFDSCGYFPSKEDVFSNDK